MLTFSVNQEYNEAFRGVYFLRMREKKKKFSQISYLLSFSSSNLKVSIYKKKKKKPGLLIVLLYTPITSSYNPESILF